MMKRPDAFGFCITAAFHTNSAPELSGCLPEQQCLCLAAPMYQSVQYSALVKCGGKVWVWNTPQRHHTGCHLGYKWPLCQLYVYIEPLFYWGEGWGTIHMIRYHQRYSRWEVCSSVLFPPVVSFLTSKWPVAGSAIMDSFWKVLAWTSSSSSLLFFSPASSSSSSSRLWRKRKKRRMLNEIRSALGGAITVAEMFICTEQIRLQEQNQIEARRKRTKFDTFH